jgi:peptide/nickel transport system ATP-binding protein
VWTFHDLSLIKYMTGMTAIMSLGKMVDNGPTAEVITHPLHPYAKALLQAVPEPDPTYIVPDLTIRDTIP